MSLHGFINGKFLPVKKIFIGVNDLGFLRSYSVFDYIITYNGKPFLLNQHLERFSNSAKELNLKIPFSQWKISEIITTLLKRSGISGNGKTGHEAGIRLILTGGYSKDSMTPGKPNLIILTEKLQEYPAQIYSEGVKLITCEFQRPVPRAKSTNYMNAIRLKPQLEVGNAFEVLYYYNNEVLETSRNNFFIVKKNAVSPRKHTSEIAVVTQRENVLPGITRKVILNLAREKYIVEERTLLLDEIWQADEAFISGTTRRITPVVMVDDITIGNGKVGEVTKALMMMFDEFILRETSR